jgi:NADP-dependent 3-hydroxy acid dehydrogenase YdfG
VALVSGASGGIGAATARRLAREGASVALVARRRDRLEALAVEIATIGGTAIAVQADITDPGLAEEAVTRTLEGFARLDILVNTADIMLHGTALHATLGDWDRMIALNVRGVLQITHAAVPYLIDAAATSARGVADIVNVSSTAGRVARPASSVYNLTKFGLNGFSEALRQELLVERVRVGVVEPGTVTTEALRPEDIADAISYIVTREHRVAVNEILVRAGDQTW